MNVPNIKFIRNIFSIFWEETCRKYGIPCSSRVTFKYFLKITHYYSKNQPVLLFSHCGPRKKGEILWRVPQTLLRLKAKIACQCPIKPQKSSLRVIRIFLLFDFLVFYLTTLSTAKFKYRGRWMKETYWRKDTEKRKGNARRITPSANSPYWDSEEVPTIHEELKPLIKLVSVLHLEDPCVA
jgi:hypothetical protein